MRNILYENTIVFNDLKPYYDLAKEDNKNKKFGRYYLKLQNMLGKTGKDLSEEVLHKISSFLPTENPEEKKE